MDGFYGFHFDDNSVFHEQIDAVSDFKFLSFVDDWQRNLGRNCDASAPQFMSEASLIGTFQKSRAQAGMDFHGCGDGRVGDLVYRR